MGADHSRVLVAMKLSLKAVFMDGRGGCRNGHRQRLTRYLQAWLLVMLSENSLLIEDRKYTPVVTPETFAPEYGVSKLTSLPLPEEVNGLPLQARTDDPDT